MVQDFCAYFFRMLLYEVIPSYNFRLTDGFIRESLRHLNYCAFRGLSYRPCDPQNGEINICCPYCPSCNYLAIKNKTARNAAFVGGFGCGSLEELVGQPNEITLA